jgi:hypothetical protein
MGRKSNHLMERVYAHLSKYGCRKSELLADPELTDILFLTVLRKVEPCDTSQQNKPVRIQVRIDPSHPLVCLQRRSSDEKRETEAP